MDSTSKETSPFLADESNQKSSIEPFPARDRDAASDDFVDAQESPVLTRAVTADTAFTSAAAPTLPASGHPTAKEDDAEEPANTTITTTAADTADTGAAVVTAPASPIQTPTATIAPAPAPAQAQAAPPKPTVKDLTAEAPASPQRAPTMSHESLPSSKPEEVEEDKMHKHKQDDAAETEGHRLEEEKQEENEKPVIESVQSTEQEKSEYQPLPSPPPQEQQQEQSQEQSQEQPQVPHSETPEDEEKHGESGEEKTHPEPESILESQNQHITIQQPNPPPPSHPDNDDSLSHPQTSTLTPTHSNFHNDHDEEGRDKHFSTAPTMIAPETLHAPSDTHSNHLTTDSHDPAGPSSSSSANFEDMPQEKDASAPTQTHDQEVVIEENKSVTGSANTPAIGGDIGHNIDVSQVAAPKSKKKSSSKGDRDRDSDGEDNTAAAPSLTITLLLTNGARHPFEITSRYLKKRGQDVEGFDPFNMSVYTLKELILKEWRSGMFYPIHFYFTIKHWGCHLLTNL